MIKDKKRKYTITIKLIEAKDVPVKSFASVKEAQAEAMKTPNKEFRILRLLSRNYAEVRCIKCEYKIKDGFQFCPRCGEKVK